MVKCLAFDCFGTVFDMCNISRDEIRAYVQHVRKNDFTPFRFPDAWYSLKAHPDAAEGIRRLRKAGFVCVTLSNGSVNLLHAVSEVNGIEWDGYICLESHGVYKPHAAAYCTVEADTGFKPAETMLVTANPTFGDVEGAAAIGMHSQIIRQPDHPQTILELADLLI